ncbi:MAG: ADP-ribosylation factor-like protein [Candidatus Hodarchaeota archaeon]
MTSSSSKSSETNYYKIIFLGSRGVGKTSIIRRILNLEIDTEYQPTIGVRFHNLEITSDKNLYLQLWDVSGNESYRELYPSFLKNATAVVLIFDYKNKESQVEFKQLYETVIEHISPTQILLVGNNGGGEIKEIPKILDSWAKKLNLVILPLSVQENTGHSLLLQNILEIIQRKPLDQEN